MKDLERFVKTMHFEAVDHPPFILGGIWPDTLKRWEKEGLPPDVPVEKYLGVSPVKFLYAGPDTGPYPHFEKKVLEEKDGVQVRIDHYGRTVRDYKNSTTMPEWLEFPVKTAEDLKKVLKERFNPDLIAQRWTEDWEEKKNRWLQEQPGRDYGLLLDGGCYYGHLRNLCGVKTSSYLFCDAPELVEELFERIYIVCAEGIKRAAGAGLRIDYLGFGEDIAFKTSTLVSPAMFRKFLLPRYKKIVELARQNGIEITYYDSDGNINPFMELYFEAGIDAFWPCEVAADMDPVDLRKRYGKRIKMAGGMDKRELAKGKDAIKKEVMRKVPLIEEGGYIPAIDHSVSSDISLENYTYFISLLKDIYGVQKQ